MMEAGNFRYGLNVTQIQRRELMDVNTTFRLHTSECPASAGNGESVLSLK